jgi:hypothetical protein
VPTRTRLFHRVRREQRETKIRIGTMQIDGTDEIRAFTVELFDVTSNACEILQGKRPFYGFQA